MDDGNNLLARFAKAKDRSAEVDAEEPYHEWHTRWLERLYTRGKPTAVILFDDAGKLLGLGQTMRKALDDAYSWIDDEPCPHCGLHAEVAEWRAYPLDSKSCEWLEMMHIDADALQDGIVKWYEERGAYLYTIEATCITCRGSVNMDRDSPPECETCDSRGHWIEIERDVNFPDERYRIDIERAVRRRMRSLK